jgi:CheY-like chemotaxis protein
MSLLLNPRQQTVTTILLIDDNPDDLATWSTALLTCTAHYSVLTATSGEGALDVLRHEQIDCVLLDLDLPKISGFELLFQLVGDRKAPGTPVVVLTRLWNPTLHQLTLENGAQAHLVKSRTSVQDLEKAITQALTAVSARTKKNGERLSPPTE